MKTVKHYAAWVALTLLCWAALHSSAANLQPSEQYTVLNQPLPTETGKNIEVLELFYYGCPHCATLEPTLSSWTRTLPKDVSFRHAPVVFRDSWMSLTKAFYAAEAIGAEEKLHPAMFIAIHEQDVDLANEDVLFAWVEKQGVDAKKFADAYRSFAVDSKANRARELTKSYGLSGVPSVLVDGKYLTSSKMAGGHMELLSVLDDLIKLARKNRAK
jgi:thiol:disulfide interchange protein DsbA